MNTTFSKIVTVHGIMIDSVSGTIWEANKGGLKDIEATTVGVSIYWGPQWDYIFVPWSNVRYAKP